MFLVSRWLNQLTWVDLHPLPWARKYEQSPFDSTQEVLGDHKSALKSFYLKLRQAKLGRKIAQIGPFCGWESGNGCSGHQGMTLDPLWLGECPGSFPHSTRCTSEPRIKLFAFGSLGPSRPVFGSSAKASGLRGIFRSFWFDSPLKGGVRFQIPQ